MYTSATCTLASGRVHLESIPNHQMSSCGYTILRLTYTPFEGTIPRSCSHFTTRHSADDVAYE